jgi:hypothetical protein
LSNSGRDTRPKSAASISITGVRRMCGRISVSQRAMLSGPIATSNDMSARDLVPEIR